MSGGCVFSLFLRCLPTLTSLTHGSLGSATSVIQAANSLINSLKVSQILFFLKIRIVKRMVRASVQEMLVLAIVPSRLLCDGLKFLKSQNKGCNGSRRVPPTGSSVPIFLPTSFSNYPSLLSHLSHIYLVPDSCEKIPGIGANILSQWGLAYKQGCT